MKEFTQKVVSKAQEGVDAASSFLSDLPVIGDYQDKERRREADRRLRESIARSLESARKRVIEIERLLLNKGKLTDLPYVDVAANRLQTLIDRIRTAPSGYAGFFDMETIREPELEKLHQFDQGIAATVPEIETRIDAMQQAIEGGEDYSQHLVELIRELDDLGERLDHRKEAIRSVAEEAPSLSEQSSLEDADRGESL
jgi:DNA repair exonuclease SbcCD ATPase subunit